VVNNALTTSALFIAVFIGTGTTPLVELEIAFHHGPLLSSIAASLGENVYRI